MRERCAVKRCRQSATLLLRLADHDWPICDTHFEARWRGSTLSIEGRSYESPVHPHTSAPEASIQPSGGTIPAPEESTCL